ncbi:MAG: hypothetical protein V1682_00830 [Candidatus Omnitrophota bacterium]
MPTKRNIAVLLFLFYACLITYLVINTGIISDDFQPIACLQGARLEEVLIPKEISYFIETPLGYYTHYIWYRFFSIEHPAFANAIKTLYIILAFYMSAMFFRLYLERKSAYLASFIFIFFPSHDATIYWFMGQYLTLSIAFYLYAFYLAHRGKYAAAFLSALAASFISYGSTPIAAALFLLFLLGRRFKAALMIAIPNIIYVLYFAALNFATHCGSDRLSSHLTAGSFIRQYILQILTFFDAALGPSMWLKIWYALPQISNASAVVAVLALAVLWRTVGTTGGRIDKSLGASLIVMLFLAFGMFAVSGRYPQTAFNLGNRVTIYGSLLIAYLIIAIPMPKVVRAAIIVVMILSAFGISDHWKAWGAHQDAVVDTIRQNRDLNNSSDKRVIYVSGNQYSRYGPFSHIEFFSEGFVVAFVFKYATGEWLPVDTINRRFRYIDGWLVDTKYGHKAKVDGYINVYDSEKNAFFKVEAEEINSYIEKLSPDNRHWSQIIKSKYIKDAILHLMPRLEYAFGTH